MFIKSNYGQRTQNGTQLFRVVTLQNLSVALDAYDHEIYWFLGSDRKYDKALSLLNYYPRCPLILGETLKYFLRYELSGQSCQTCSPEVIYRSS